MNLFTSLDISSGNVLINITAVCRLEPNALYFKLVIWLFREDHFCGKDLGEGISSSVSFEGKWDYVCLVFFSVCVLKAKLFVLT